MKIVMRPMSARDQLEAERRYPAMLPGLLDRGLSQADAVAVAYNTSFLYGALELTPPPAGPEELLERFSLGQIARLCEEYEAARGGLEALEVKGPGRRRKHERPG